MSFAERETAKSVQKNLGRVSAKRHRDLELQKKPVGILHGKVILCNEQPYV